MHTDAQFDWEQSVGRLVHHAAVAEGAVARLARLLSGVDPVAAPQLLPLELEALVRVVRNLVPVRVRDVGLVNDLLDWTHQIRKLYAVRTSVVHTVWGATSESDSRLPVWSSADVGEDPLTVADLLRTASRLERLCGAPLDALLERTRRWCPPDAPPPGHATGSATPGPA